MKEILDDYVKNTFDTFGGPAGQAKIKFEQFEYNYKKHLPADKNAYILDIGPGRGEMLTCLKNWGYNNYLGVDISPSVVKFCKSLNLNCELANDTVSWLSKNQDKFDAVTLFDVLEHIKKEETIKFLNSIKDSLKKGGVLIIQTPNLQAPEGYLHRYNDFTHEFGYIEHSLRQVLVTAGFNNVKFGGFEEFVFGGKEENRKKRRRNLVWKYTRFVRTVTGNLNPEILHPVFYAVAKKD